MIGEHSGRGSRDVAPATVSKTAVAASRAGRSLMISLSFWTAVCVPFLIGALLVWGIQTPAEGSVFLGLTGLEVLALLGGRSYATG